MSPAAPDGVVIVGAGLAGYSAARALRSLAPELSITIVTADDGDFYSKPTLSVSASQRAGAPDLVLRSAEQMRKELGCRLITRTRVHSLDCGKRVLVAGDEAMPYSKLVLAIGAVPWTPPVPGLASSSSVLSVNHLDDYRRLIQRLSRSTRVAILGAGFVGCELANDLQRGGHAVTLIDRASEPLPNLVSPQLGKRLRARLEEAGIVCRFGVSPLSVEPLGDGVWVELDGERPLAADLVICATGLRAGELAESAGLKTQRGVVVDRSLRTSDEHVYALGDCASLAPYNLQFVAPIPHAAAALARSLLGASVSLTLPPLAISVKTPCFPVVSSAGPREAGLTWEVSADTEGTTELAFDAAGALRAFALGGSHVKARGEYLSRLPPLLGAAASEGAS
ncbi:FAD-dependent oxidoreductase [Sorangium cellulosum]|uniref:Pyridine nucleotide-disulfide oxidoreductase n=1 Tax=Sorangium cellulosum TaxID=56 RepID=A0A150PXY7_SORCE|nr:FAD-dependent oxidoreductase [Sorangium cellulosum]KYF60552.1 hypothetical protein BE15_12485 [Sorangium cellulosum]